MTKNKIDKNKRYIILDTNILSSFSNADLGNKIIDILREVVGYGYGIAISDITIYELVNESSFQKELQMTNTFAGISRYFCKRTELTAAARMAAFYKDHGLHMTQFEVGDRIIAGTSVVNNCIIFTLNGRDFPQPFFKEIERRMIDYTSKEYPVCVPAYFMEPQIDYIISCHNKRMGK